MTSIRDIAKLSGFSVSTVSRVLNNHPYVSTEKREIITKIIQDLDYTANQNAINLSLGKTNVIGVILPYTNNPTFDKMMKGILTAAIQNNYNLMLLPTNYHKEEELNHLNLLKNKRVDGLIITSKVNSWEVLREFTKYGTIVMCEKTHLSEFSAAYSNRLNSYLEVFTYLKEIGHQQVAFTSPRSTTKSTSSKLLMQAYEETFSHPKPAYFLEDCYSYEDGLKAGAYFLNQPNPPTAIYANGDEVAAGIYHFAQKKGLILPQDLLIIGEENLPIGKVLDIPSMDHQVELLGTTALNLAIQTTLAKKEIPYILRFPN
ncbi:LacI family DNA-binding transcriptional regulator [Carnobacterium gallinarum]|uniref:LacI family DNA-binding transcriptional regulator n=1 Tax=Carnobacterium gallinarum TaxID=2749 RepID=UPI000551DF95|nr:LacI family DNA-binding transcriptional regulator [Carnobacterium gallinarum]